MNPIVWIGGSLDDLKAFPDSARQSAGHQLSKIQHGELPDDWKSMGAIGVGVSEIRVRDAAGIFRVIYVARFGNAIYVLHAFQKKSQKTSWQDVDLARKRFRSIRGDL
jgi:phage-related protein